MAHQESWAIDSAGPLVYDFTPRLLAVRCGDATHYLRLSPPQRVEMLNHDHAEWGRMQLRRRPVYGCWRELQAFRSDANGPPIWFGLRYRAIAQDQRACVDWDAYDAGLTALASRYERSRQMPQPDSLSSPTPDVPEAVSPRRDQSSQEGPGAASGSTPSHDSTQPPEQASPDASAAMPPWPRYLSDDDAVIPTEGVCSVNRREWLQGYELQVGYRQPRQMLVFTYRHAAARDAMFARLRQLMGA